MKKGTRAFIALSIITGLASCGANNPNSASGPKTATLDSRWAIVAEGNKVAAKHSAGEINDASITKLNDELAELKRQCDNVPAVQNPPCHDDMMRLAAMANATVNPGVGGAAVPDPGKLNANPGSMSLNPRFPTNIPKHVSPEMTEFMVSWTPYWQAPNYVPLPAPEDYDSWDFKVIFADVMAPMIKLGEDLLVSMEMTSKEEFIGGVRTVIVSPKVNRHPDKVLVHVHGGAFYGHLPETTYDRIAPLADMLDMEIVSVDYKLMPGKEGENWDLLDQRDQVIDVLNALSTDEGAKYKPENVGIYGCSAGSGLVAMSLNEMSKKGEALPGAAVMQGAMVDFTFDSDSYHTLRYDDPRTNVDHLVDTIWPMLKLTEEKVNDPRYSTVLDDFEGRAFPPMMIQSGTKEIQMSDGIRFYSKLRSAGHVTQLDLHDAMQHCFHGHWGTPEAKLAVERVAEWFEEHLALDKSAL